MPNKTISTKNEQKAVSISHAIDACIHASPKDSQAKLRQLRLLIEATLPRAELAISYGMPTFKLYGKGIAAFAGYKKHIGFYPMSGSLLENFKQDLTKYKTSKGAVQFPLDKPLPVTLIKKLLRARAKIAKAAQDN